MFIIRNNYIITKIHSLYYKFHHIISLYYKFIIKPKDKLIVKRYLSGEYKIWFNNHELEFKKLLCKKEPMSKNKKYSKKKQGISSFMKSRISRKNKHKSPWSIFNPGWLKSRISSCQAQAARDR